MTAPEHRPRAVLRANGRGVVLNRGEFQITRLDSLWTLRVTCPTVPFFVARGDETRRCCCTIHDDGCTTMPHAIVPCVISSNPKKKQVIWWWTWWWWWGVQSDDVEGLRLSNGRKWASWSGRSTIHFERVLLGRRWWLNIGASRSCPEGGTCSRNASVRYNDNCATFKAFYFVFSIGSNLWSGAIIVYEIH
jgi:hypothetical protein